MIMKSRLILCFLIVLWLVNPVHINAQSQNNAELATQYFSTGEFDKALVFYEKFYDQDPLGAYPNYLKCLLNLKDYDKAEKLIRKHQKRFPMDANAKLDMATVYELRGENEKAVKVYDDAIKNLSTDIGQINLLGNAFMQRQLYDYAVRTYLQGRKLVNGSYPFSFELAEAYNQQGSPDKMVAEYIDVIDWNPQYVSNVQTILQNKIANDTEGMYIELVRTALLRKIQKNPQESTYNELLYWLFLQEKDFESALIQAKSLDKRNNENGDRILSLGRLCVSNRDFTVAIDAFRLIVDKGNSHPNYVTARMELINASYTRISSSENYTQADLELLAGDYRTALSELGTSVTTAPLVREYAHLKAFYLHDIDSAMLLLQNMIEVPNFRGIPQAEAKLELADIYVFNGLVWDAALLYGQVDKDFKNDAIGREAKFRNARLSYYLGEFEWAKDQLNVLKSATSQLISNDALSLGLLITDNTNLDTSTTALLIYSRADLYDFQNQDSLALITLDTLLHDFPDHSLTDEAWFKRAGILMKSGRYAEAIQYLQKIVESYPDDILGDDAIYRMGDLYETRLNDKEKAKEKFELLLTKYPGSLYSVDARRRFRALRGDKI
jgi:tetratricopeptide (TPR) repeat protein